MHKLRLTSYSRYIYLNPIEGIMITYKGAHKFPHSHNEIIKLNTIRDSKILLDNEWFFKKGFYYF